MKYKLIYKTPSTIIIIINILKCYKFLLLKKKINMKKKRFKRSQIEFKDNILPDILMFEAQLIEKFSFHNSYFLQKVLFL